MNWPPQAGELLPRADEATGIREKLAGYSLDREHHAGGPKAWGFLKVLGISMASIEHLEAEIRAGIQRMPITSTRPNPHGGINCVVEFPIRGVGERSEIVVKLRTAWLLQLESPPRLISAYLKP